MYFNTIARSLLTRLMGISRFLQGLLPRSSFLTRNTAARHVADGAEERLNCYC